MIKMSCSFGRGKSTQLMCSVHWPESGREALTLGTTAPQGLSTVGSQRRSLELVYIGVGCKNKSLLARSQWSEDSQPLHPNTAVRYSWSMCSPCLSPVLASVPNPTKRGAGGNDEGPLSWARLLVLGSESSHTTEENREGLDTVLWALEQPQT